jgi:preprotein translocase subunit SecA
MANPTQTKTVENKTKATTISKSGAISNVLSNLVGENLELKKYSKTVEAILKLEPEIQALSDDKLKAKTAEFRKMFEGLNEDQTKKKMNEILPQAFAVVREATWRTIGKKQFPVQLIGGIVLHDGRISEMKTGEGKTFVAPLAAYLNALPKMNQVHIVTVNDYLARIGASWMGCVFDFLGLKTGVIQPNGSFYFKLGYQASQGDDKLRDVGRVETMEDGEKQDSGSVIDVENLVPCDKKRAYWIEEEKSPVDIVYAVNSELGFDYLRDNMVQTVDQVAQKAGLNMAIIDEVDSILIDEARTPLIISAADESSSARYKQFARIANQLNTDTDYDVDEKRKTVTLTDYGISKIENILGLKNLYSDAQNVVLIHHLDQALKAKALFNREKEYVVRGNDIIIVDEFTGRMMFGRRYSQGLHQALEAKEGLIVQAESKTVATITYQNYFRMYKKLSGMTGTAATESEELFKIYKLLVVTIPTNKPMVRKDFVDKLYKTEIGKFSSIVKDIKEIHQNGQPILIGTTSIEKNLLLSKMLNESKIPHETLNATNHEQEARIIRNAGKKGMVTLATNIAGRGVDIVLGGQQPEDKNSNEYKQWQKDHDEVVSLGGLFVIGTERHESRRIDNQLRGRSGRQGDSGVSQFYISFEDYILRVFGGDKVSYYAKILPVAENEALQFSSFSWLVEQAQKRIEGQNFDVRKQVTEYDDVINKQRSVIYSRRKRILLNKDFDWNKELENAIFREIFNTVSNIKKPSWNKKSKDSYTKSIQEAVERINKLIKISSLQITSDEIDKIVQKNLFNYHKTTLEITNKYINAIKEKWNGFEELTKSSLVRLVFLTAIDTLWTEHLVTIDNLQDSTRFRYIAQKDPLTEFKEEAMNIFIVLLKEIDSEIFRTLFLITPEMVPVNFNNYDENIKLA